METRIRTETEGALLCDVSQIELPDVWFKGPGVIERMRRLMAELGLRRVSQLAGPEATRRERFLSLLTGRRPARLNETDLLWLLERFGVNPLWILFGVEPIRVDGRMRVLRRGPGEEA